MWKECIETTVLRLGGNDAARHSFWPDLSG